MGTWGLLLFFRNWKAVAQTVHRRRE